MLNFSSIIVFSENPKKLGEFYEKIFETKADWEDGGYVGFKAGNTYLSFGPHDKVKGKSKNPERILLNFETNEVKKEAERVKKLGAKVIAEPYSMKDGGKDYWIATFADPDGNFFQLVNPWEG